MTPSMKETIVAVFECPDCGNTRRWRNAASNMTGTRADCGNCGQHVEDPTIKSRISIQVGWTNDTTFGDGQAQVNYF